MKGLRFVDHDRINHDGGGAENIQFGAVKLSQIPCPRLVYEGENVVVAQVSGKIHIGDSHLHFRGKCEVWWKLKFGTHFQTLIRKPGQNGKGD